jgi:hypothetical protein
MDYVSRPEVREAALRAELGSLLNSIERPAKARRIAEIKAQLGETEPPTGDAEADDSTSDEGDGAPRARRAPTKKAAS